MRRAALLALAGALLCASPAAAAGRSLLAGCSGGSVCLLAKEAGGATQCPPLPTGESRFCDARCNAGSGNSGACNTCPIGFNTPGSANYVGDARACYTSTNQQGAIKNPLGTCAYATCAYVLGSGKNPGYYTCTWKTASDGSACDDGDKTTENDVCIAGVCKGTLKTCPFTAPKCQKDGSGVPDPATGNCVYQPLVCNDNNACTTDSCDAGTGQCKFVSAVTCNTPPNADCYEAAGTCSPADGKCAYTAKAVGAECADLDSDKCTPNTCQPGTGGELTCQAGARNRCDDGNACTTDTCDAATGACSNPVTVTCTSPPDACKETAGTCAPATGTCEYTNKAAGTDCGSCSECYDGACINFEKDIGGGVMKCFRDDSAVTSCPAP